MPSKSYVEVQENHPKHLVPAMLNRRRISLKKILNRYMGLHFTQLQPIVTTEDISEAGLEDPFVHAARELFPSWKNQLHEAEPLSIEVRGVAIALDEEISFSYYRYKCLQSPIYTLPLLPKLDRYAQYCQQKNGAEAESSPAVERVLRKRALNDFMQDMLPAVHHVPLIRMSVYDQFADGEEQKPLGKILEADNERFYLPVADFVSQRLEEIDRVFTTGC